MKVGVNLIVCNQSPVHRRATEVAILSLLASDVVDVPQLQLVAVDNGSMDDTAAWLRGRGISVLRLDENVGIAPARNMASRLLLEDEVEIIIEIHNDHIFPLTWSVPLLRMLREHADVGIACASLLTPKGLLGSPRVPIDYAWSDARIMAIVEKEAGHARCPGRLRPGLQHPAAKRAAMLRQIGLYDERYRWGNFEDTDEVYRAASAGWRYVVVGESVVWHHYWFSRLALDPDHRKSYQMNQRRFFEKWPNAGEFLAQYHRQTEAIYR